MIKKIQHSSSRPGIALLVMLFIVATISVLSFGFVMKADSELSCGDNTIFRTEMDYIGQTALNYAKSLIVNPQDVTTGADGYWQGGTGLQIEPGDDYFDIEVVRSVAGDTPECTYDISCQGYRLEEGVKISETKLTAQLRLDPFIAFYSRQSTDIPANMTVYGDVYCGDDLDVFGNVKGDLFADSYSDNSAEIDGQFYDIDNYDSNVSWSGIDDWRFEPTYYIDTEGYWPAFLSDSYGDRNWGTRSDNPAGIYFRYGNLKITGDVTINGTLVVTGDLEIKNGPLKITATKNNPALIVMGKTTIYKGGSLEVTGLVQTRQLRLDFDASDLDVTGGLYIYLYGLDVSSGYSGSITVKGDPMIASIKLMSASVNMMEWSPVGGAYFKSIKRDK